MTWKMYTIWPFLSYLCYVISNSVPPTSGFLSNNQACQMKAQQHHIHTHTHTQFSPVFPKLAPFIIQQYLLVTFYHVILSQKDTLPISCLFRGWSMNCELAVGLRLPFPHSRIQAQGPNLTRKCQIHGRRTKHADEICACCQRLLLWSWHSPSSVLPFLWSKHITEPSLMLIW